VFLYYRVTEAEVFLDARVLGETSIASMPRDGPDLKVRTMHRD
jgi:hypothetical protein